jgi:hypothetical protein
MYENGLLDNGDHLGELLGGEEEFDVQYGGDVQILVDTAMYVDGRLDRLVLVIL